MLAYGSDVWSVCWMYIQAERQRAELQRELATLGDHVDEANEATRSQV